MAINASKVKASPTPNRQKGGEGFGPRGRAFKKGEKDGGGRK